jgi:anti-sigma B factor antagonist
MARMNSGDDATADGEPDGSTVSVERVSAVDGVVILRVTGQLDVETGPELERALADAGAEAGDRIVLDFDGVDFMDSSGIAVLLSAAGRGTPLELRNPSNAVRRVIDITGLDQVLRMSTDA